jgi:hypothetical protein
VFVVKVTIERNEASVTKEDRYYTFIDAFVANDVYNHYVDFIKRDKNRETRFGEVRFASCQLKIEEREEAENLARSNQATCLRDSNRRTTEAIGNLSSKSHECS